MSKPQQPKIKFIRKVCADLPEEEIVEAEARFIRYLKICLEVEESLTDEEKIEYFDKKILRSYDDRDSKNKV